MLTCLFYPLSKPVSPGIKTLYCQRTLLQIYKYRAKYDKINDE